MYVETKRPADPTFPPAGIDIGLGPAGVPAFGNWASEQSYLIELAGTPPELSKGKHFPVAKPSV